MSFIITVYTNEGIVMASDSRTTYTSYTKLPDGTMQANVGVQTTDTVYKTFLCNNGIGISTCGDADIVSGDYRVPMAGYIEKFILNSLENNDTIDKVSEKILNHFRQYKPIPNTTFVVAGYDPNTVNQRVNNVYIGRNEISPVDTSKNGVTWNGEMDVFQRLVMPVGIKKEDVYLDLPNHSVAFNLFTLQDAINFAEYAIDVTIKTMAFQERVKTVGGPIDILVIKPGKSFWVKRKELHA